MTGEEKEPIERLLRWRLTQAEAEAPPAPSADKLPEQLRKRSPPHAHAVPTVIDEDDAIETLSLVLSIAVRDGVLFLEFELGAGQAARVYDAIFVDAQTARPLLSARAA